MKKTYSNTGPHMIAGVLALQVQGLPDVRKTKANNQLGHAAAACWW